nr:tetratricopeptide repeat protein [Ruegeria sp. HKCCD8929]
MSKPGKSRPARLKKIAQAIAVVAAVASCTTGQLPDNPDAPGVNLRGKGVDPAEVGHRLVAAGEYEVALDAFTRAALDQGMTAEIMTGIGTANLGLGRLGQAEEMLRRAVEADPEWPEAWNNLGVLLVEQNEISEAAQVFRRAYALDNGESDAIRDNLRFALAKMENPANNTVQEEDYKLVQRGQGEYVIRKTP